MQPSRSAAGGWRRRYPPPGTLSMSTPSSRSAAMAFQTAARVTPSSSPSASPDTREPQAAASLHNTCSFIADPPFFHYHTTPPQAV